MENDNIKIKERMISAARSLGASFPVTASIVHGWNEWESNKRWEHCQQFFEEVFSKLKELEEKSGETPKLDSDEVRHLLSLTLDKVMREHREQKRKKFAEFFVKTTYMGKEITFDDKLFFLETLDELNEFDLSLLMRILKDNGKLRFGDLTEHIVSVTKNEELSSRYVVSFSKLRNKGLIGKT